MSAKAWLVLVGVAAVSCANPATDASPTTDTTSATSVPIQTTIVTEPPSTVDTATTTVAPEPLQGLAYREVRSGLPFPIALIPGRGSDVLVAFKRGTVSSFDGTDFTDVLDITDQVTDRGERGLLGMALHPTDPDRLFLHYSDGDGSTVVSEFAFDGNVVDANSERILLSEAQPAGNHNGGWIQFGPDGSLYLGLGDGGGADDQFGNGQADGLLAGLVRIDIDSATADKFAKGLRNPWRFWIEDDLVYVADVGQNSYEEISVAPLAEGVNYGWSVMEGKHCFRAECDPSGLLEPVLEVEHGDAGTCSITGGVVYSGTAIPELAGHYLYSDYCGGYLRSFRFDGAGAVELRDWTDSTGLAGSVVSFGVDHGKEVYVLTTDSILKLEPLR